MVTEAGTSKSGGTQGCTISLQAAVHLRCVPRVLLAKKKKTQGDYTSYDTGTPLRK